MRTPNDCPYLFLTLWATPRSTSTAFEWMMRQRGDFRCFHEPFNELYYYGEDRRSKRDASVAARPGHTYASVWSDLIEQAEQTNLFLKDFVYSVAHFLTDEMLDRMTHTFLIRDPRRVIQGIHHHWPDCTFEELGFESLNRLFQRTASRLGQTPVVISSDDLLSYPKATTRAYCQAVGIEFIEQALSWESGERKEVSWYGEGIGPWHDALRESKGIEAPKTTYPPIEDNPQLMELYHRCLPHYQELLAHRLCIAAFK